MKLTAFIAALTCVAAPAFAEIQVQDAYARASSPKAKAGAAFMVIENTGMTEDRLIEARSDVAKRVELHTHKDMGEGVMRMMEVEEGIVIPAHGEHALMRGADHVMFMGLNRPLLQGEQVDVTLVFENAGEVAVTIPVDLERQASHGSHEAQGDHSAKHMGH